MHPSHDSLPATLNALPLPDEDASLTEYKGTSLRNIGLDKKGQVIQYVRSTKIARQVAVWVAGGYSANDICIRLNMRPGKLKELYGQEIAHGLEMVGMEMTSHIVSRAKKSDRMAVFFAKARMGWRDGDSKPLDTGGLLNVHIHG